MSARPPAPPSTHQGAGKRAARTVADSCCAAPGVSAPPGGAWVIVTEGVGVVVAVGVDVGDGVAVGVGVDVAVAVGEGVGVGSGSCSTKKRGGPPTIHSARQRAPRSVTV